MVIELEKFRSTELNGHQKTVRTGAVTVEFSVVLVVLVLFIFGGIELTRFTMLRHTASHAAYLAARESIFPGANVENARALAQKHLENLGIKDAVIDFDPNVITEDDSLVTVSVRIPLASNDWALQQFVKSDAVGTATLLTERPPIATSQNLPTRPITPRPTITPTSNPSPFPFPGFGPGSFPGPGFDPNFSPDPQPELDPGPGRPTPPGNGSPASPGNSPRPAPVPSPQPAPEPPQPFL